MDQILTAFIVIIFTIIIFLFMKKLYVSYPFTFLTPILTSTIVIVILLNLFGISYDTYMTGGSWMNQLLGPAIVGLAFPLYSQRKVLADNKYAILSGVFCGVLAGMVSGIALAMAAGINEKVLYSILPKSFTTPIAIELSSQAGGIPSMTAIFVMFAGLSGAVLGPQFLRLLKITSPVSIGIAMGCASHAIGTSKSSELGLTAFSMSSVSMTLSAVMGSFLSPIILQLYHSFVL
ncbi:LrgB family protein [Pradoshia sp.]